MHKLTAETITETQIRQLRDEAATAGDRDMVQICDNALMTDASLLDMLVDRSEWQGQARQACADAINNARAQED